MKEAGEEKNHDTNDLITYYVPYTHTLVRTVRVHTVSPQTNAGISSNSICQWCGDAALRDSIVRRVHRHLRIRTFNSLIASYHVSKKQQTNT